MHTQFAALDIEATGMDPTRHEIIEVAVVAFDADGEIERFSSLVRPHGRLSLDISTLTGIEEYELDQAPPISDVLPELRRMLAGRVLIGHSIDHDLDMLTAVGLSLPNDVIDTHELAVLVLTDLRVASLAAIAERLGVQGDAGSHRALDDCERTIQVFAALRSEIEEYDDQTLDQLAMLTELGGMKVAPLFADIANNRTGALFAPAGSQVRRTDELAFTVPRERPEPLRPTGSSIRIEPAQVAKAVGPGGLLSHAVVDYEPRPAQAEMTQAVARAFNKGERLVVEAGTGTGKSAAYLLPAVMHAVARGERVVVSTATLALQDQLHQKDVPALQEAIRADTGKEPFSAAVLKGRSNYLCLRRWFLHDRNPVAGTEDARMRAKVVLWLGQTDTGDRAELRLSHPEEAVFRSVSAEGEACVAARCPFQHRNQCFLYRARREAEHSHVVVVNHALLLSDNHEGASVIPDYEHLIIDEAHHLEDQATNQFGFAVNESVVMEQVNALIRTDGPILGGTLLTVASYLERTAESESDKDRARRLRERLRPAGSKAIDTRIALNDLFTTLDDVMRAGSLGRETNDRSLRITQMVRASAYWGEAEYAWDRLDGLVREIEDVTIAASDAMEAIRPDNDEDVLDQQLEDLTLELAVSIREMRDVRQNLKEIVAEPDKGAVYWVERNPMGNRLTLNSAPLHVGELLRERIFDRKSTVVLTSATMTTDGTFDYINDRLGLEDAKELIVTSPFDYEKSTLLYIADDIPEPNAPAYQARLNEALIDLISATRGRALILFTSYGSLQATRSGIKTTLEDMGIVVLGQRIDGTPRQLIDRLRTTPNVAVLGTSSFWEGVDIVGPALSALVIAKLPFAVPTDPVFSARSEQFEEPFLQYAVPQAVLKFKQGFGRLIRSSQDHGICVILDRRVVSKRYGSSFVQSLPSCRVVVGSTRDIGPVAEDWLDRR